MKPNLFIVGAPKCGTTAWASYLGEHPEIFFSPFKEPHHFNHDFPNYRWVGDRQDYLKLFAKAGGSKIAGEASVFYLYSQAAARAIRDFNPGAKIIALVRDQEDYLPSLHNQIIFNGDETITDFERAWRLSGKRDKGNIGRSCRDEKLLDYAALGRFSEQLQRYYDAFPSEQIRVFHFRDWTRNPRETYQEILRFLGVPEDGRTQFQVVNESERRRFNWLTPILRKPPRAAVRLTRALRERMGVDASGLLRTAKRLNSTSGSINYASEELKEEIRSYYAKDNALLERYLWRPRPPSDTSSLIVHGGTRKHHTRS